jgi:hypothetical protein
MNDYHTIWSGRGSLPGSLDWPHQRIPGGHYAALQAMAPGYGGLPTMKEMNPSHKAYVKKGKRPGAACKGCGVDIGRGQTNEGYIRCPSCRKVRRRQERTR